MSVIDPLFTLPLLALVLLAAKRGAPSLARLGLLWALGYLLLGVLQQMRAEEVGHTLAAQRGHSGVSVSAKPSFGNLLLWKVIYEYDGRFWVDAVRAGLATTVVPGDSVERLDTPRHLPWLDPNSQQARDLERFRWFSSDHLAVDRDDPLLIVDMRYSLLPNEIKGLWGIRFDPDAPPEQHVGYTVQRSASPERVDKMLALLRNDRPGSPTAPSAQSGVEPSQGVSAQSSGHQP